MPKRGHQPRGLLVTDNGKFIVTLSATQVAQGAVVTVEAQWASSTGSPVPESGKVVTWGKTGVGGSFNHATSTTNSVGVALIQFTVSTTVAATYTISATGTNGVKGTSPTLTVVADSVPASVALAPATLSLAIGGTSQLTATLTNAIGTVLTNVSPTDWVSSNEAAATVSATGLVTAIAAGSATITARYGAIVSSATALTVTADVTPASIAILGLSVPLSAGHAQVPATVKNAAGTAIPGLAPTAFHSSAPSVATINASGVLTIISVGSTTITATLGGLTSNSVTVTVSQITSNNVVLGLEGPTIPSSAMSGLGLSWYETNFATQADIQWTAFGPAWNAGNTISEYERAATFYVWALRTGDQKWLDRANQLVLNYRTLYLAPAGYNPSPHYSQAESLYLHWKITGDTASRDAVLNIANHWLNSLTRDDYIGNLAQASVESRIQARVIDALWMAETIWGAGVVIPNDTKSYTDYLNEVIASVLGTLNSNGYAPFPSTCGGSLNYMCGMLADVLSRIYDQRPGTYNATILTKLTALGTYLWNTQWRGPTDESFNYMSVLCTGTGSPTTAPDENGQIVALFGWLGKTTADSSWFTKGDLVLHGMQLAFIEGYRQFSQSYVSSYRYLGYRYPGSVIT